MIEQDLKNTHSDNDLHQTSIVSTCYVYHPYHSTLLYHGSSPAGCLPAPRPPCIDLWIQQPLILEPVDHSGLFVVLVRAVWAEVDAAGEAEAGAGLDRLGTGQDLSNGFWKWKVSTR